MTQHHAFVIEAEAEEGIRIAEAWLEKELPAFAQGYGGQGGMKNNPDIIVLRYGLFSIEDARRVSELAAGAPFRGQHKAIIIAASRAYHEAQNALLKLFEEPPPHTYLFLILPTLGGILPTLRSRVHVLNDGHRMSIISEQTEEFIKASRERRSAIIKRLASGRDEVERRENRDEAIAIINGIEQAAYNDGLTMSINAELLREIQHLRAYLYSPAAPVKMILEHLSIVLPRELGKR